MISVRDTVCCAENSRISKNAASFALYLFYAIKLRKFAFLFLFQQNSCALNPATFARNELQHTLAKYEQQHEWLI